MPHTWGTSDRYQSLVFGCALETFYNPFMCTHRVPVRSWAPATCLSGDMSRKSALKISVQPLLCCRMVDTPFNQAKPQSLIYKVKIGL